MVRKDNYIQIGSMEVLAFDPEFFDDFFLMGEGNEHLENKYLLRPIGSRAIRGVAANTPSLESVDLRRVYNEQAMINNQDFVQSKLNIRFNQAKKTGDEKAA